MKPLKIDPAFKDLIPPLSKEEFSGLEKSILSQGRCRDTIKIWNNIIIDGHNRYAICQKHGIPLTTQKMRFQSKKDAELWIVQNQLGRRNLPSAIRIKLALHKETLLREKAKQNRKGGHGSPVHVRKAIAKEAGVSEQTVYRYMRIRELSTPEQLHNVETGQEKIGTAYRNALANISGLEVTTRIVESFHGIAEPADISSPYRKMAVQNNIERLERLFSFISDNCELLKPGDDMPRICRRLKSQLKAVKALTEA